MGPLLGSFLSRQLCAVLNVSNEGPRASDQQGQMKGKYSAGIKAPKRGLTKAECLGRGAEGKTQKQ